MQKNIFSTLSRYAVGAEENYLTEAFVFLLQVLLERQPNMALNLINKISGLPERLRFDDPSTVSLVTQRTLEEGRPDIEIRANDRKVVYVEVKHDSLLHTGQLEAYNGALQRLDVDVTNLVLLSRSRTTAQSTSLSADQFHHVCWYDVSAWLKNSNSKEEVSKYLIHEFLRFLYTKRMSMKKVGWHYIDGVPALFDFIYMLETAINESLPNVKVRRTAGWSWRGFKLDGGIWCGIRYQQPLQVRLESNNGNDPRYIRELDLQQVHFFSLTEGEQFETLVDFVQQAYADAPTEDSYDATRVGSVKGPAKNRT